MCILHADGKGTTKSTLDAIGTSLRRNTCAGVAIIQEKDGIVMKNITNALRAIPTATDRLQFDLAQKGIVGESVSRTEYSLARTAKCCLLYQVDLISGSLKISLPKYQYQ